MKAYRYNHSDRNLRKFNQMGEEKNPNKVRFFGKTLEYAKGYELIIDEYGDIVEVGTLEVVEVTENLFDMNTDFYELKTFVKYAEEYLSAMRDLSENNKYFTFIYKDEYQGLVNMLRSGEFQELSDFDRQTELIAELKELGFDGYETKNEIALWV